MKTIFAICFVAVLTACGPNTPRVEEGPQEVCVGMLVKMTDRHLRMTCEDGRVINYTSYKYAMTVK